MMDSHSITNFRSRPTLRLLLGSVLALSQYFGVGTSLSAQTSGVQLGRPSTSPMPLFGAPIVQAAYLQPPKANPKQRSSISVDSIAARERLLPTDVPSDDTLKKRVQSILRNGDDNQRLAMISLLAEAAELVRSERVRTNFPHLWMSSFYPQILETLHSTSDPLLQTQSLVALSQLQSEPVATAKTLGQFIASAQDKRVRVEAVRALNRLAEVLHYLNENPPSFRYSSFSVDPAEIKNRKEEEMQRKKWWKALQRGRIAIVNVAIDALSSSDADAQQAALETIETIVDGLVERTNLAISEDRLLGRVGTAEEVRELFHGIAVGFQQASAALTTTATVARDPRVRVKALFVLEKLAQVRAHLRGTKKDAERLPFPGDDAVSAPSRPMPISAAPTLDRPTLWTANKKFVGYQQPKPILGTDPLGQGFRANLDQLSKRLTDPDVRVRRTAVDLFESMGMLAEPAIPAIIKATEDSDRFVRWAAARTLGRLAPKQSAKVVPVLAGMLEERDISVRMAVVKAIEEFGEDAAPAVSAVAASIERGDGDYRIAGMEALQEMGQEAASATNAVAKNLTHPKDRVRVTAAETLGTFGPAASAAIPALRGALRDPNDDVRRAANNALLEVTTLD